MARTSTLAFVATPVDSVWKSQAGNYWKVVATREDAVDVIQIAGGNVFRNEQFTFAAESLTLETIERVNITLPRA